MRRCEAGAIIAFVILMQGPVEGMSFNILRAILSPPVPRITRVRNASPRELRLKNSLAVSDFLGLVKQYHYPAEEHNVTTIDGYNLRFHRIPGSARSSLVKKKPVVFVQHGLFASSDSWVLMGPGRDLAYLLVDAGYDVWMLNVRGNRYSRRHLSLSPNRPEFWHFSWHENGVYDMTATIDYMLAITGVPKVTVIGHSMGCTIAAVLLSVLPEYNRKVDLVVALAPVITWTAQYRGPLTLGLRFAKRAFDSIRRLGVEEILPLRESTSQLFSGVCRSPSIREMCKWIIFLLAGSADPEQLDSAIVPSLLEHYPAGTSLNTIEHYWQNIANESFREFDYGYGRNYVRYGSDIPPEYPLHKITVPVLIYYGVNDPLAQPPDIRALEERLPNVVATKAVPWPFFNHFDFVLSKDAKTLLYDDMMVIVKKYKSLGNRSLGSTMKLFLVLLAALIGSAIADDGEVVWTEEMVQDLFTRSSDNVVATIPELITSNGYLAETHHVVTEDGYILAMHRVNAPSSTSVTRRKPVAFLMHGLLSSSADWLIMGHGKSLGYLLADAGYDVWLGNARGNTHSKNHTTIKNLNGRRFWRFDWHEIGVHDLPAMIDYVLDTTHEKQVVYMGHSQGTTAFYVMAAERPEYNDKIKVMFSLAPVAYMSNLFSPMLRIAATFTNTLETFFNIFGMYEFMPSSDLLSAAGSTFCNDDALTQFLCTNVLFVMCGFNRAQLNTTLLPTIFQYSPAGASSRQLVHYGQEIQSGYFRWWDHGITSNLINYGSFRPPNYDLSKITAPVHLIYSDNDWMAAVKDVEQLHAELGNSVELYRVLDGKWNHLDFVWGINAKELVYDPILTRLAADYAE
ncbi:uncharacterized protein LOC107221024 [Neodiprion lecontei]|uniref:Uncharacterized protein LOC107221024 n=1 Tax=Neodiprion lecontei TaxID=441921 RepID=A0ABM3GFP1_NEOLC|nr:uncharacterized protein LOC107221024 [Neodiprion lecontei]